MIYGRSPVIQIMMWRTVVDVILFVNAVAAIVDQVAIKLDIDHALSIDAIAATHGYKNIGPIGNLQGYYLLQRVSETRHERAAVTESLKDDPRILWFESQRILKREKRDNIQPATSLLWKDPLYRDQWYLHRGAHGGYDMRIQEAWFMGYSGQGVVVSILDDGIQPNHPDLIANYDAFASTDINGGDSDPTPQDNGDNRHGTRCAGEVAAAGNNDWCGIGVAYHARIGGVRMLDGNITDVVEAKALSFHQDYISIYSSSWGPSDNGSELDGPQYLAQEAIYNGITRGRQGKGNIFVWASGNGGMSGDSCSCDGYSTSPYTLTVSSATFENKAPWYSEECPAVLTTTYSSGRYSDPAIVTTDYPYMCTDKHSGTSASAPLAAGIVALALEANANLTWRDVLHLIVRSSNATPLLDNPGWTANGVGRQVSNQFGYGLMDALEMTKLAKNWKRVPEMHTCKFTQVFPDRQHLRGRLGVNYTMQVSSCQNNQTVNYIEQVQVAVDADFSRRGDLKITITSPSGTKTVLLPPRKNDNYNAGFVEKWPFLSVQQWGENPRGAWTLNLENMGSLDNTGTFYGWTLTILGTASQP